MKKFILLLLVSGVLACGSSNKPDKSMRKIESAVSAASTEFMSVEGVVGVGEGKNKDNEACIVVFTSQDSSSLARKIPPSYQGFEVILSNIGEVKAQ
jgi:hypothetical protein